MNLPDRDLWLRGAPVLDELLELPAAQRVDRLAALAAEDPGLAMRLAALVAAHDDAQAQGFLAGAALPAPEAEAAHLRGLAGVRLGAWRLVAPLGEGGSGGAWRARRDDGRYEGEAAVKLLHLALLGHAQAERFRREGTILARLEHPNIARLLDAGVAGAGQPYLVLELVAGEPIDAWCDARRLTVRQRLALFTEVLAAVAHAHRQLVVHRDIKPANILVDHSGRVKLLDFGVAAIVDDGRPAGGTVTREHGASFTPAYAAPEQWRGDPTSMATDVYALGVLLFHLLAGRHPTQPPGANLQQAMHATLEAAPLRLGVDGLAPEALAALAASRATSPARLARQLDADLGHIVARALRKEPGQRYPTVEAFAEDLRRHAAREPVSARAGATAYRVGKFLRRHRLGVSAACAAGLALAVGVGGVLWQAARTAAERDRALAAYAQTQATQEFLTFLLGSNSARPYTTKELLDRGRALADVQFRDDPGQRARLHLTLSGLYSELDEEDAMRDTLARAAAAARQVPDAELHAELDCAVVAETTLEPDAARAEALFRRALASLPPHPGIELDTLAYCRHARAMRAFEMEDDARAIAEEQAALELLGPPRAGNRTLAIAMRETLASALDRAGRPGRAIELMREALRELASLGRAHAVGARTLQNNLGVMLVQQGDYLGAEQAFEEALAAPEGDPPGELASPALRVNHAKVLLELGHAGDARREFQAALATARANGEQRIAPRAVATFAGCPPGELRRCLADVARARDELSRQLPPGHTYFAQADTTLGRIALAQGEPALARGHLEHALAAYARMAAPDRGEIRARTLLARAELQLGDPPAALADATRAVALARAKANGTAPSEGLGSALLARALALRALHAPDSTVAAREASAQLEGSVGAAAPATREARALL